MLSHMWKYTNAKTKCVQGLSVMSMQKQHFYNFLLCFFFCLGIKTVYNLFSSPNYPVVITSDVALYSELYRTTISFLQTLHFGLYYDCF